jgi:hypothetical protein
MRPLRPRRFAAIKTPAYASGLSPKLPLLVPERQTWIRTPREIKAGPHRHVASALLLAKSRDDALRRPAS